MATYFHGNSEIQANGDGLQTLILMNPAYVNYSDNNNQPPQTVNNDNNNNNNNSSNFVFLNSNTTSNTLNNLPHAPSQPQQHYVGIPLQQQDLSSLHGFFPRAHYNLYNPDVAREVTPGQQGLSLSLSSQQQQQQQQRQHAPVVTRVSPSHVDDVRESPSSVSGVSNGVSGVQSVLLSSKYLKAAQELLDEVVSVGKGGKSGGGVAKSGGEFAGVSGDGGGEGSSKSGIELTTAERQEIQMKKAKLVNMLDEVEQRYRQYHHQMQIVISWFEQASGIGSAKTYTALALQTISKQFRCLKDAILGQIRVASKSLGEEDSLGGKTEGSRLKYVDNQIRQQRALQQLGMIQHNAWRPQRGLPERSVTVLRAWLFEHFLHPYPKDSDKIMLAKQTGLTRSQVSNWFINARVRLWKPMVEEMYTEEMKENERTGSEEKTSKSERNEDSTSKSSVPQAKSPGTEHHKSFMAKQDNPIMSTNSLSPAGANLRNIDGFNLIGSSEMEGITQGSPKKPRSVDMVNSPSNISSMNMDSKPTNVDSDLLSMKFGNERQGRDGFTLMGAPTNFTGGFGSFPMELGRFGAEQFQAPYSGNGVSLTLGLPHCENLSMAGGHQTFMPNQTIQLGRGVEIGETNDFNGMNTPTSAHSTNLFDNMNTPTSAHSNNVYDNMNIQNRKRFAAQLLRDFVA